MKKCEALIEYNKYNFAYLPLCYYTFVLGYILLYIYVYIIFIFILIRIVL